MRRLTILLVAVGALLLVPVAQAAANGIVTVSIAGNGSGEVSSVGGSEGFWEGSPPIECSTPAPGTGTCETELVEEPVEPGAELINLKRTTKPGTKFSGWIVEEGFAISGCNPAGGPTANTCVLGVETGGGNAAVTAVFECTPEGEAEELCGGPRPAPW